MIFCCKLVDYFTLVILIKQDNFYKAIKQYTGGAVNHMYLLIANINYSN